MTAAMIVIAVLAQAPATPEVHGMAKARLYVGPSAGAQALNGGTGAVIGFQGFNEFSPNTASFWGIEVLAWKIGNGALPIFTGDFGLRWAPFPTAWLRPFLTANLGLSLLVIIPVPSFALGVGLAIPLGGSITLDAAFRARYALNYLNTAESVSIGSVEIGLGF
jgi:hypothetical protein